jgi:hypothetical protein
LNESGDPVLLSQLGCELLDQNGVDAGDNDRPFRIAISKKMSKIGNPSMGKLSRKGLKMGKFKD